MVDAGLSKSTHWVLGAVFAVLSSLALAKGPSMPHGGGSGGGYPHAGFQHQVHDNARAYAYRNEHATHGVSGGHGGYNATQRMAGPNDAYRVDNRGYNRDDSGGFQYAGAITPVSAETRSVPRPPEDESMVRAGSIRADVARYNEERGAPRPPPRPPEYMSRPPGPSPYRN
ncbi:MAG: hypothetical protein WCA85_05085 [Paraburkholderia sp.]|uniref:hypothetical protein n=1 Tax=Paraburkholderia sp. TaxID=1926495 RepID=UPI003C64A93F